jgi:3-oxocholest-4-en-26-oate---CoA ligase
VRPEPVRVLPCAPFMHGGGQWAALQALCEGNTVSLQRDCTHFDPADIWDTVEAHRVHAVLIIGDAFARPLAEELERRPRDLSSLRLLVSGGAAMQPSYKERIHAAIPTVAILDRTGASESGTFGHRRTSDADSQDDDPVFDIEADTVLVDEERTGFLTGGHTGTGWLGKRGRIPLGYLNDAVKTAATFPTVGGQRVALPGDRAQLLDGGRVRFLGRDSAVVNSAGEKVFAEEVEAAVRSCPGVADAVVCGRPSEAWGSEVVAVVAPARAAEVTLDRVRAHCAKTLAGYKLPKAVVLVDAVQRTAAGKADYRWAREVVRR